VPLFSPLGGPHVVRYTTSMHDQAGFLTKDPHIIAEMMEHLQRKIIDYAPPLARYELDPQEGADTVIVAYGVTARSAREAAALARKAGRRVSLLVLKTLYPVPEHAIEEALGTLSADGRVLVPEMNLGQYVEEVRKLAAPLTVVPVSKMNTDLVTPAEILEGGGLL